MFYLSSLGDLYSQVGKTVQVNDSINDFIYYQNCDSVISADYYSERQQLLFTDDEYDIFYNSKLDKYTSFKYDYSDKRKGEQEILAILHYKIDSVRLSKITMLEYKKNRLHGKIRKIVLNENNVIFYTEIKYRKGYKCGFVRKLFSMDSLIGEGKYIRKKIIIKDIIAQDRVNTVFLSEKNDTLLSLQTRREEFRYRRKYGIPILWDGEFQLKKGIWKYYDMKGNLIFIEEYSRQGVRKYLNVMDFKGLDISNFNNTVFPNDKMFDIDSYVEPNNPRLRPVKR
jgi:hypothetical protein